MRISDWSSDVCSSDLRPVGGDRYAVKGAKMWTSGGEHELSRNIVHMTLARIEGAAPGVKGLSLFIVPRYRLGPDGEPAEPNDVTLVGLNHKMGYRGTVNTALSFGDQDRKSTRLNSSH